MKRKLVIGLVVILGLVAVMSLIRRQRNERQDATSPTLKETEHEKIVIDTQRRTITTVTRKGGLKFGPNEQTTTEVERLGPQTVITEDDEGRIVITSFTHGFSFQPGLSLLYDDGLRLGIDSKFYYYKQFGLLAGVALPSFQNGTKKIDLYLGVSYDIPARMFSNTSVWAGYSARKEITVGLRVGF